MSGRSMDYPSGAAQRERFWADRIYPSLISAAGVSPFLGLTVVSRRLLVRPERMARKGRWRNDPIPEAAHASRFTVLIASVTFRGASDRNLGVFARCTFVSKSCRARTRGKMSQ